MARKKTGGELKNWQHLVRVVALAGAVLGTLALGAVLRVDSPAPVDSAELSIVEQPQVAWADPGDSTNPDPRPEVPVPIDEPRQQLEPKELPAPRAVHSVATSNSLSVRVSESERLIDDSAAWTLQFMLTCDPAKAQRILDELRSDTRLHLLPTVHNDQSCLRICWNEYSSHDAAIADRDFPPSLLALSQTPIPRKLTELTP